MIVLGIHGGSHFREDECPVGYANHDAAAALVKDGGILACIEEERLTRIKHTNCFPATAIQWCLDQTHTEWASVDWVVTNMSQQAAAAQDASALLTGDVSLSRALLQEHGLTMRFRREFGVDVANRIRFCPHHLAHAWSAFAPSSFDRSLILSVDGNGDGLSGMVLVGDQRDLKVIRRYPAALSLGHLYVSLIKVLGLYRFEEYKAMGLAPYGDPNTYGPVLSQLYTLLPEGNYQLKSPLERYGLLLKAGILAKMRLEDEPFSQFHKDFAAAVQKMLETIVFHILTFFRTFTGESHLCLAGGVAQNCSLNGKILYSGMFDKVYVQPAAHDAGGALGAAWWLLHETGAWRPPAKYDHLYYGTDAGTGPEIRRTLDTWREMINVEEAADIVTSAAELLANGAILGWVQGRSEFGPRALGNRSILADPRPPSNKSIINNLIKKREEFRPFAPSVVAEKVTELFDVPNIQNEFPFMIFVVKVREQYARLLGAVRRRSKLWFKAALLYSLGG